MRRSIRAPRSPAFTRSAPAFGLGLARRCITRSSGRAHKSLPGATCEIVSSARTRKLKAHCVTSTSSSAKKTDLLLRQTRLHFPRFEEAKVEITPIEKGGSDRRFYRVKSSPDHT